MGFETVEIKNGYIYIYIIKDNNIKRLFLIEETRIVHKDKGVAN